MINAHAQQLDLLTVNSKKNQSMNTFIFIKKHYPKLHLYTANETRDVLSWYISNGGLTINQIKTLCSRYNHIRNVAFYHVLPNLQCIAYNDWILSMIAKSIKEGTFKTSEGTAK